MSALITGFLFALGFMFALAALNAFGIWLFVGLAGLAAVYFALPWLFVLQTVYPWFGPIAGGALTIGLFAPSVLPRSQDAPHAGPDRT